MTTMTLHDDNTDVDVEFAGTQIGYASSRRDTAASRWTEVTIYRTEANAYIAHRVGISRIVHRADSECSPTAVTVTDLYDDAVACSICKPDLAASASFREEVDRSTVFIAKTATGIVEAMYSRDVTGLTYIASVARTALVRAGKVDEHVQRAVKHKKVR